MTDEQKTLTPYAGVNADMARLQEILDTAQQSDNQYVYQWVADAQELSSDLVVRTKTIETAALLRAMEFAQDTVESIRNQKPAVSGEDQMAEVVCALHTLIVQLREAAKKG